MKVLLGDLCNKTNFKRCANKLVLLKTVHEMLGTLHTHAEKSHSEEKAGRGQEFQHRKTQVCCHCSNEAQRLGLYMCTVAPENCLFILETEPRIGPELVM